MATYRELLNEITDEFRIEASYLYSLVKKGGMTVSYIQVTGMLVGNGDKRMLSNDKMAKRMVFALVKGLLNINKIEIETVPSIHNESSWIQSSLKKLRKKKLQMGELKCA